MSILIFILILALLVLVHEFGHFIAAKKQRVKVEEFGIGFPPRIFGLKKGETLYSINILPLGGFVKLYGEEYKELAQKTDKNKTFVYKKPWQKALIIVAGIVGNFILGWILISYLFTQGVPVPIDKVIVEKVQINSPAAVAGLHQNDRITTVSKDNKVYKIHSSADLINYTKQWAGQSITLNILRNGQELKLVLQPRKNPPTGQGPLGVFITSFEEKKYPWYQAPFLGLVEAANITSKIVSQLLITLLQVITFQKPNVDISGPIGIAKFTGEVIKVGKNATLELIALLSLNLAVINILPFPALDGGRLAFVIYEWITKKRVNEKVERYTNAIGIIMLLSLAVLISINDIAKIMK